MNFTADSVRHFWDTVSGGSFYASDAHRAIDDLREDWLEMYAELAALRKVEGAARPIVWKAADSGMTWALELHDALSDLAALRRRK